MNWRIYYGNGKIVRGSSEAEWLAAPSDDVQVVVLMDGKPHGWSYKNDKGENTPVLDRDLWTGEDSYDPFGWGAKKGALLSDVAYFKIWNRACGDD